MLKTDLQLEETSTQLQDIQSDTKSPLLMDKLPTH
jgi:hypothetical protein